MPWKKVLAVLAGLLLASLLTIYLIIVNYDFNHLKPYIAQQVEQATGRKLTIAGELGLALSLRPSLVANRVEFANAPWGSRPQMATVERCEAQVKLIPLIFGDLDFLRLVLISPDIILETNKQGGSNLDFKSPGQKQPKTAQQGKIPAQPKPEHSAKAKKIDRSGQPRLSFKQVIVQNGKLTIKDGQTGDSRTLVLKQFKGSAPEGGKVVAFAAQGIWDQQAFDIEGTLGALPKVLSGKGPMPVSLNLKALGAQARIKGTVAKPTVFKGLDLEFDVKGDDAARLTPNWKKLKVPYEASGKLTQPSDKSYRITNLKLMLGQNDLSGKAFLGLGGGRPLIKADLSSKSLDLRAFLETKGQKNSRPVRKPDKKTHSLLLTGPRAAHAAGQAAAPKQKKQQAKRVFSQNDLPWEGLSQADAEISLKSQKVILPKLTMGDLGLKVILKSGIARLEPFRAKIAQGRIEAKIEAAQPSKRIKLSFKASGCRLEQLLEQFGVSKAIEGPLEMVAELGAAGSSPAKLMSRLDGVVALRVGKGVLYAENLDLLGGDLAVLIPNLLNPFKKKKHSTTLECLAAGLLVKKGQGTITAALLNTDAMVVMGKGKLDFERENMDLHFEPQPKKALLQEATGGALNLSLGRIASAFRITGAFSHPRAHIDRAEALTTLGRAIAGFSGFGAAGLAASALGMEGKGKQANCEQAFASARQGKVYQPKAAKKKDATRQGSGGKDDGQAAAKGGAKEGADAPTPQEQLDKTLEKALKGLLE